jgi:hypothetical protein
MSYARLYLDGSKSLWALAKCDICHTVHRYPAADAARASLECLTCGQPIDVRQGMSEEATERVDIPSALRDMLGAGGATVDRIGGAHLVAHRPRRTRPEGQLCRIRPA